MAERVVLDTTRSTLANDAKSNGETNLGGSETAILAERQPFGAFAEMALPARPCFRPPCCSQGAESPRRLKNARHSKIARACR